MAIGLTQDALAREIGCERTALANYETGSRPAPPGAVARFANKYGLSMDWFYLGRTSGLSKGIAPDVEAAAAELGAVVGAPVAEWPMAVSQEAVPRLPGKAPRRKATHATLHEAQDTIRGHGE
jgi:transcriptional regulator with XRE-family HTH domain